MLRGDVGHALHECCYLVLFKRHLRGVLQGLKSAPSAGTEMLAVRGGDVVVGANSVNFTCSCETRFLDGDFCSESFAGQGTWDKHDETVFQLTYAL